MPTTTENCSPENVENIRAAAIRLRLDGCDRLELLPAERLAAVYNGTGPAFLPDAVRTRLDRIAETFLPAVMIHDVDYSESTGRHRAFAAANDRLLHNCIACAYDAEPWYSWRRYALILEAFVLYRACVKFGWIPWLLSYNQNTQKKGQPNA